MVRRTDALRAALLIVWNYVYSDGWPVAAQGDAEKALRDAFAEADTIDGYTLRDWALVGIGFALGVLLCVISWVVGGTHP